MATITKKELANRIADRMGLKKVVAREVIQQFIDEVTGELARGNRLEFREFGVFEIKTRSPRQARNPRTGVKVAVPEKAVVNFKPGRAMRERVQRGCSERAAVEEVAAVEDASVAPARPAAPMPSVPAARKAAGSSRPSVTTRRSEAAL